jgi:serine/threonine protein kinase
MGCWTSVPQVHPSTTTNTPSDPEPPPADSDPVSPTPIPDPPPDPDPPSPDPGHALVHAAASFEITDTELLLPEGAQPPDPLQFASLSDPDLDDTDSDDGPVPLQLSASYFNPANKPTIFDYNVQAHIGRGAHSDVFLLWNRSDGQYYAAKKYSKTYLRSVSVSSPEPPFERLMREIDIMVKIDHPNCIRLIEVIDDEAGDSLLLILPYADAGPLSPSSWKSDRIPEKDAQFQFAQVARAVQYIHGLNIIHRDLKPDNILKFHDGRAVLADFSVSRQLDDENEPLLDTEGTPAYYAPEECLGDPYHGKPADVWAFGMMLYVMIYGNFPFLGPVDETVFYAQFMKIARMIVTEKYEYPDSVRISPELRDFFSHVLEKDPTRRYTIGQVLQHPWLRNVPQFP